MKIGITYDTKEMYCKNQTENIHFDFAEYGSISTLKKELEKLDCYVDLIGNKDDLLAKIKQNDMNYDLIYNTSEGINSRNRESIIPAIMEACDIKFAGTDAYGLALSLDKAMTKLIAINMGIKTPKYIIIHEYDELSADEIENLLMELKFPVIVKPNNEGNSSGIKVCNDAKSATQYIIDIKNKYATAVLCEEFIYGTEITVPVIGNNENTALWCITTVDIQRSPSDWLDVNAKTCWDYNNLPLNLSENLETEFKSSVFKMFKAIGCRDFARFDFRLSTNNEVYFIEVNPLPALFYGGSFYALGKKNGLTYRETLRLIINTAAERLSIPKI